MPVFGPALEAPVARAGAVSHERLAHCIEVRAPIVAITVPDQHFEGHASAVQLLGQGLDAVLHAVALFLRPPSFREGDELHVGESDPTFADKLIDQPDGYSELGKRHFQMMIHPICRDREAQELLPAGAVLDAGNHLYVAPRFGHHMLNPALPPRRKLGPIEELRIRSDWLRDIKGNTIQHGQQVLLEPIKMVGIRHGADPD